MLRELSSWCPAALQGSHVSILLACQFDVTPLEALGNKIWLRYFGAMLRLTTGGSHKKQT